MNKLHYPYLVKSRSLSQVFSFGNSLVFDATGTNDAAPTGSGLNGVAEDLTKQTAIDAVRAILDYNPLTVSIFAARLG